MLDVDILQILETLHNLSNNDVSKQQFEEVYHKINSVTSKLT